MITFFEILRFSLMLTKIRFQNRNIYRLSKIAWKLFFRMFRNFVVIDHIMTMFDNLKCRVYDNIYYVSNVIIVNMIRKIKNFELRQWLKQQCLLKIMNDRWHRLFWQFVFIFNFFCMLYDEIICCNTCENNWYCNNCFVKNCIFY